MKKSHEENRGIDRFIERHASPFRFWAATDDRTRGLGPLHRCNRPAESAECHTSRIAGSFAANLRKPSRNGHQNRSSLRPAQKRNHIRGMASCGLQRHELSLMKQLWVGAPKTESLPDQMHLDASILPMGRPGRAKLVSSEADLGADNAVQRSGPLCRNRSVRDYQGPPAADPTILNPDRSQPLPAKRSSAESAKGH